MRGIELFKINKLYFGYEEISRVLGISLASAKLSAHRYTKQGILIRLKKNFYMLKENWKTLDRAEIYCVANLIQVPSYVSLMSALDYYQISTQIQQNFIESIAQKRTKEIEIEKNIFNYTKINKVLYFGFVKDNNFFIATPEKAFLDAIYLKSLGRYNFDQTSLDFSKFNIEHLTSMLKYFPVKTNKMLKQYEYFAEA